MITSFIIESTVIKVFNFDIQEPLVYLRTRDVTHSRLVTYFRILKIKILSVFNVAQIRFIVDF